MIRLNILFRYFFFLCVFHHLHATSLAEQFATAGYVEICDNKHGAQTFDALYACFDELIEFLQKNPAQAQKLFSAKERFMRTKDRSRYATDFFGFYDESERKGRYQISFYYAPHFHAFISTHYPELKQVPAIARFLQACFEIQQSYEDIFSQAAADLGLEELFAGNGGQPPILFKVITYLPSYVATKPHYDGTAFSLFLDSTDTQSLFLSPYKSAFAVDDFFCPLRTYSRNSHQNSILLIPGTLLNEYAVYPSPHIVLQSGKTRYAAIAFAMRPNFTTQSNQFTSLPTFKR
jgi:hypothetical protein